MLNKLSCGKIETDETKQWMSYKEIVFHIFEWCNSVEIEREVKAIMGQGFYKLLWTFGSGLMTAILVTLVSAG